MNTDEFPHLFSPIDVGPLKLRCRVFVSAHEPRLGEDNIPGEAYVAYQRARARGGAALQITGATSIHPSGMLSGPHVLHNMDDRIIPAYQRVAEAVHEEGGRMLAQLAHSAATVGSMGAGKPMWAPSPVASELTREIPHVMTQHEIAEMVRAFGAAARRTRLGELDGVEILGAFGFLIAAFLSPYSNKRTDAYGGSLENRMRFALEVVDAVREGVGSERIVGMRIPGDERVTGGLDIEQMKEVAQQLEATGKLDYLNVIVGTNYDRIQRAAHWPPTPAPHGLFVELASQIKQVVSMPVFAIGRVVDPAHAERILAEGHADMVGMTRAHIADPDLLSKTRAGRLDDIRPCVGANVCISVTGRSINCFHNPETGREHAWGAIQPAKISKHVVVIGGGPAGLEAARVAALRGHRVELYEAKAELGGQLRLWSTAPAAGELARVVTWQQAQLQKSQVRVHLEQRVTKETLAHLNADAIIIATGAEPAMATIPGSAESSISMLSPHELIEQRPACGRAVVWDELGGMTSLAAAETLATIAGDVFVVTPGFSVGEDIDLVRRVPLYQRLLASGVEFFPNSQVTRIDGNIVVIRNVYTREETTLGDIDLVVSWLGNRVAEDLKDDTDREIHMIGDCVSPREVHIAMAEGAQIARDL